MELIPAAAVAVLRIFCGLRNFAGERTNAFADNDYYDNASPQEMARRVARVVPVPHCDLR